MPYHELFTLKHKEQNNHPNSLDLHTGWYEFYWMGGFTQGNVLRIGSNDLSVRLLVGGVITMPVLEFLDSQPKRI